MTIETASRQLLQLLTPLYESREAANITALVLEKITGMDRVARIVHKQDALTAAQVTQWQHFADALQAQKPVQYVLGEAWFAGMNLYVDENVLIPRPETEELVQWCVEEMRRQPADDGRQDGMRNRELGIGKRVLDVGTGSGCIALALKKYLPAADLWALDASAGALYVAQRNAAAQQLVVQFIQQDFLDEALWPQLPQFDCIVSNPPYIPFADKAEMQPNVLHYEPHLALFVPDEDALLFYRKLAAFAANHLSPGGSLLVEIHESRSAQVQQCFAAYGFETATRKDMQGKARMVSGVKS